MFEIMENITDGVEADLLGHQEKLVVGVQKTRQTKKRWGMNNSSKNEELNKKSVMGIKLLVFQ